MRSKCCQLYGFSEVLSRCRHRFRCCRGSLIHRQHECDTLALWLLTIAEVLLHRRTGMVQLVVGRVVVCLVCHVDEVCEYVCLRSTISMIDRRRNGCCQQRMPAYIPSKIAVSKTRLDHIRYARLEGHNTTDLDEDQSIEEQYPAGQVTNGS